MTAEPPSIVPDPTGGPPGLRPSLARAFATSAGTTIVLIVASGLFGVISTRALGPAERGLLATATVWTSVAASLVVIGLPQAVIYHVGRSRDRAAAFASTAMAMAIAGGLLLGLIGVVLALTFAGDAAVPMAILLAATAPLMATGCGLAGILGLEEYGAWGRTRLIGPLSALAAIAVAVSAGGDTAVLVAVVTAASWLLHFVVVIFALARRDLFTRPQIDALRDLVAYGWRQLVAGAGWLLTYKLDQLYLSIAVAPAALGLYAVAASIGEVIAPVAASAGSILLARVAAGGRPAARSSLKPALTYCFVVGGLLCLGSALFAGPLLSTVFGDRFSPAEDALRIYLMGALALALATVLADTLRGLGRPLDPAKAELGGALASITLLSLLVPTYGIEGAAAASTASYTLVLMLQALLVRTQLRERSAGG